MGTPRKIRVEFSTENAFHDEYVANIAKGGIFVVGGEWLDVSDRVLVELHLAYRDERIELEGEVVHCVGPSSAVQAGVAVEFTLPVRELRARLGELARAVEADECAAQTGRRAAPRSRANVETLILAESGRRLIGRSRDISSSGMLLSIADDPVAVGEQVTLGLQHPRSGARMQIAALIVRHLRSDDDEIVAMAVEFLIPDGRRRQIVAFLGDLRAAEHSRRLGSISGPIGELGIENLLQMFGSNSARGRLGLLRGAEEGEVWFEGGALLGARLGRHRDLDALRRLLGWRDGRFEFQAHLDEDAPRGEPIASIEAALLESLCESDEQRSAAALGPEARFEVDADRAQVACPDLSKTEQAVIDLARGGLDIGRMLAIIPESELTIYSACDALLERGVLRSL